MKNLIGNLRNRLFLIAIVFALVGTYAFNGFSTEAMSSSADEVEDLNWFDVDAEGVIGSPLTSEPTCNGSNSYCAVGLDDTQVDMFGQPSNPNVEDYTESEIELKRES